MIVKDIMTADVVTVKPDMDIHDLAKLFIDKNISGAPVVDNDENFLGVVLEEGLILQDKKVHLPTFYYFLSGFFTIGKKQFEDEMQKIAATTVSGIMETNLTSITPETPVEDVATLMIEKGIHYFPVMEKNKLAGVVTKKDLVKAIAKGIL